MRTQRILITGAALVAALGLGACSSPTGPDTPARSTAGSHAPRTAASSKSSTAVDPNVLEHLAGEWNACGDVTDTVTIRSDGNGTWDIQDDGAAGGTPGQPTTIGFHLEQRQGDIWMVVGAVGGPNPDHRRSGQRLRLYTGIKYSKLMVGSRDDVPRHREGC